MDRIIVLQHQGATPSASPYFQGSRQVKNLRGCVKCRMREASRFFFPSGQQNRNRPNAHV